MLIDILSTHLLTVPDTLASLSYNVLALADACAVKLSLTASVPP